MTGTFVNGNLKGQTIGCYPSISLTEVAESSSALAFEIMSPRQVSAL